MREIETHGVGIQLRLSVPTCRPGSHGIHTVPVTVGLGPEVTIGGQSPIATGGWCRRVREPHLCRPPTGSGRAGETLDTAVDSRFRESSHTKRAGASTRSSPHTHGQVRPGCRRNVSTRQSGALQDETETSRLTPLDPTSRFDSETTGVD